MFRKFRHANLRKKIHSRRFFGQKMQSFLAEAQAGKVQILRWNGRFLHFCSVRAPVAL